MNKLLQTALQAVSPALILLALAAAMAGSLGFTVKSLAYFTALLVAQNMSFTLVSRSRQSNNMLYHAAASVLSSGIWILVNVEIIQQVTRAGAGWPLQLWYVVCTVVGSVHMHWLAVHKVEKMRSFKKDVGVTNEVLEKRLLDLRCELLFEMNEMNEKTLPIVDAEIVDEPLTREEAAASAFFVSDQPPDNLPPAKTWGQQAYEYRRGLLLKAIIDSGDVGPEVLAAAEALLPPYQPEPVAVPRIVESGPAHLTAVNPSRVTYGDANNEVYS